MASSCSEIVEVLKIIKQDLESSVPNVVVPNDFDMENSRDYAIYKLGQGSGIIVSAITISDYIDDICEVKSVRKDDQNEGQITIEELLNGET